MPFLGELPVSNMDVPRDTYKSRLEDIRVNKEVPLVTPQFLKMSVPASPKTVGVVKQSRKEVEQVIKQKSDKLLVVVGPCSVHDPDAAVEYCERLKPLADELSDDIVVIMRAYLEKPRTTVGWKGLINDPELDGSFQINKGLTVARQLFCTLTDMGMPIASEMLDCVSPKYLADCISLGAIGARTTESQLHRELASGLSFPVGFKNGTDGGVEVAADSLLSAGSPHNFMGITDQGLTSIVQTDGNKHSFVILRGGTRGTNFDAGHVQEAKDVLRKRGEPEVVMIDCSHGNSSKNHNNQPLVADDIGNQLRAGEQGIIGVMIESNLCAGNQKVPSEGRSGLKKGVSITDACIDWQTTEQTLRELASAVRSRRQASPSP